MMRNEEKEAHYIERNQGKEETRGRCLVKVREVIHTRPGRTVSGKAFICFFGLFVH